ncbi:MAG: hypothetical protein JWQ66_32 [Mucilaginibacter sp.]|nr:hypothetical protein [Mucilaginibacter sp.]
MVVLIDHLPTRCWSGFIIHDPDNCGFAIHEKALEWDCKSLVILVRDWKSGLTGENRLPCLRTPLFEVSDFERLCL